MPGMYALLNWLGFHPVTIYAPVATYSAASLREERSSKSTHALLYAYGLPSCLSKCVVILAELVGKMPFPVCDFNKCIGRKFGQKIVFGQIHKDSYLCLGSVGIDKTGVIALQSPVVFHVCVGNKRHLLAASIRGVLSNHSSAG